jgi:hypothetical protein
VRAVPAASGVPASEIRAHGTLRNEPEKGAVFIGPVHVEEDLVVRISQMANDRGMSASAVANEILRHAMAELDSGGAPQTKKAQTAV